MIKEIPILFQPEMVQVILDDKKTETRRLSGLDKINERPDKWKYIGRLASPKGGWCYRFIWTGKNPKKITGNSQGIYDVDSKYGEKGDILWVRETWNYYNDHKNDPIYIYKADGSDRNSTWRPSIHMPRVACRLWLKITDIRIERLQDITGQSAINEGINRINPREEAIKLLNKHPNTSLNSYEAANLYQEYPADKSGNLCFRFKNPIDSYKSLWNHINGPGSWQKNPWAWVIEFEKTNNK